MQNTFDAGCKPSEAIDITVTSLSVFIQLYPVVHICGGSIALISAHSPDDNSMPIGQHGKRGWLLHNKCSSVMGVESSNNYCGLWT